MTIFLRALMTLFLNRCIIAIYKATINVFSAGTSSFILFIYYGIVAVLEIRPLYNCVPNELSAPHNCFNIYTISQIEVFNLMHNADPSFAALLAVKDKTSVFHHHEGISARHGVENHCTSKLTLLPIFPDSRN